MREISKEKYVIAGILTLGIFLSGLFLGLVIEGERLGYLQMQSNREKLDFNSIQLQSTFVDQLGQENNCPAIEKTFEQNIKNLETARIRLENFDEDSKFNKAEFALLKRDYTIAQLRYWLLAKKTRDLCSAQITTVLYFYAKDELCPKCEEQAFVLTYLKKRFKDQLLIFALDSELTDEPMINILRNTYNVSEYPTLVIEGESLAGFTGKDIVLAEICPYYLDEIGDCIPFRQLRNETNENLSEVQ